MADLEVKIEDHTIIIRYRLAIADTIQIRDDLKKDFVNIPQLNKETFESFADWVLDDITEVVVQGVTNTQTEAKENEDDEKSEFEPW